MRRTIRGGLLLVTLALAAGCSISWSVSKLSKSVSDSVESASESVSDSSSPRGGGEAESQARIQAEDRLFREDVRLYTRSFARSGGRGDQYLRELGRIAGEHGISHWEGEPLTMIAIGEGLWDARLDEHEIADFLFRVGLDGERHRTLVREGYRSARR